MKKINLLLLLSIFLVSCGGLSDAGKVLRNEKIRTTDEFLVEKKDPLVLPPDFDKLPEPGSLLKKEKNDEDKIKAILKGPKTKNIENKKSTVEKSIIDKIRK
jgi:hypothetical protein